MTDIAETATPAPSFGSAFGRAIRSFALIRESGAGMVGVGLVAVLGARRDSGAADRAVRSKRHPAAVRHAGHRIREGRHLLAGNRPNRPRHPVQDHLGLADGAVLCAAGHLQRVSGRHPDGACRRLLPGQDRRASLVHRQHHSVVSGVGALHPGHRHHRRLRHQHRHRHYLRQRAGDHAHRPRPGPRSAQPRLRRRRPDPRRVPHGTSCWSRSCPTPAAR